MEKGAWVALRIGEQTFRDYWWNRDEQLRADIDAEADRLFVMFHRKLWKQFVTVENL